MCHPDGFGWFKSKSLNYIYLPFIIHALLFLSLSLALLSLPVLSASLVTLAASITSKQFTILSKLFISHLNALSKNNDQHFSSWIFSFYHLNSQNSQRLKEGSSSFSAFVHSFVSFIHIYINVKCLQTREELLFLCSIQHYVYLIVIRCAPRLVHLISSHRNWIHTAYEQQHHSLIVR